MAHGLPNSQYVFVVVADLNTQAQLNMDQSDSINNWTVKVVVSYHVVFKQVEISTILASVEYVQALGYMLVLVSCLCIE